jgi:sRNA-binding carbon storage regulator CsrA
MLVLSRKQDEGLSFDFGSGKVAKIWVSASGKGKVKIVIQAPREIAVNRIDSKGRVEGRGK